jgi:hypothetical protein
MIPCDPRPLPQNGTFPLWECYERCSPDAAKGVNSQPQLGRKMMGINKKQSGALPVQTETNQWLAVQA